MSHFVVLVKVSAERLKKHDEEVESAVDEMLAPYKESSDKTKYTEFVDITNEYLDRYNTERLEQVKLGDAFFWPWDERFRKPGSLGTGSTTHSPPRKNIVQRTPAEIYGSFDKYMSDHCGYAKNRKGRYGYYRNPNAKWDWWVIGGRWTGYFPLKKGVEAVTGRLGVFGEEPALGMGDVAKVSDLDFALIEEQTRTRAKEFFDQYERLLAGETFPAFEGPRSAAFDLGLITVVEKTVSAKPGEVALPWSKRSRFDDERRSWTDICKVISRDEFTELYADCFNPILTYAVVDDEGWHAPGKMGWFGCSDSKPGDYVTYKKQFVQKFIKTAREDDTLVCVDCHI